MDGFIREYIRTNYGFDLSSVYNYKVLDKSVNQYITIQQFMVTMKTIFGTSDDEFQELWDEWVDERMSEIRNTLTEIREAVDNADPNCVNIPRNELDKVFRNVGGDRKIEFVDPENEDLLGKMVTTIKGNKDGLDI